MPKYRGRVDCYLNPAAGDDTGYGSRTSGEAFVNIVQHISSSMTDLGIEMIASSYGTGSTGWNFWDEAGPTGHNSFACFRFHSASLGKFDCLVYCVTGSAYTTSPVNIDGFGQANSSYGNRCVGIAFSMHPSGSALVDGPWNGTLDATNGGAGGPQAGVADVGNPLWKLSGDDGATLPRVNGDLGTYSGSRASLLGALPYTPNNPAAAMRLHTIVTEDSVTIISDYSLDGNCKVLHFGPYIPRSGSTPVPQSPYFLISNGSDHNNVEPIHFYSNTYPNGIFTTTDHIYNGGIAHPQLVSGSKFGTLMSTGYNQSIGYNNFINSGTFEKFPVWVGIYEGTDRGILGLAKHFSVGCGMMNYSVSELSSSAAFGNTNLSNSKFLFPWQGDAPNTSPTVRTGRTFSFDT